MRGNKYKAVRTVVDGITFGSKAEARRYGELKLLERQEFIKELTVHPLFGLAVNNQEIATYKADFAYWCCVFKKLRVEDVKSPPTAKKRDFVLIRKLMKAIHGIDVEVIGA